MESATTSGSRASGSRARAVLVAAVLAVLGIVLGTIVSIPVTLAYVAITGTPLAELGGVALLGISLVSLQGIAFPLVAWAYVRRRGVGWSFVPASMPSLGAVKYIVGGYLAAFGALIVVSIVLTVVSVEPAQNTAGTTALENPGIIPVLAVLQFLLVGPGEELLFRGVIQGSLREHFDAWPAILLASVMFAPIHILALTGGPAAVATTIGILFLPSIVFGYLYEKTNNIVVPAFTHGLYNATLFGITYLGTQIEQTPELLVV
jgi:membrane protease YdiL (CAAX protease family)